MSFDSSDEPYSPPVKAGGDAYLGGEGQVVNSPVAPDLGLASVSMLGGVALFLHARSFSPMIPGTVIGPGLLLEICGVIFAICGIAIGIAALRRLAAGRPGSLAGEPPLWRLAAVPALLAAVMLLTPYAGFLLAGALMTLVFIRLGGATWLGAGAASVVLSAVIWFAFTIVMRVPLPTGLWF